MNAVKLLKGQLRGLIRCLCLILVVSLNAQAALEQSFEMLQVGTATYHNVTVTTKNKNYVFILHSKGMTNLKVSDLTPELRAKLGYEDLSAAAVKTNSPVAWAKQTMAKLQVPQVNKLREQLAGYWPLAQGSAKFQVPELSRRVLFICGGVLLGLYLFHSYCCLSICRKCGCEPGAAVWIPLLQIFPLLKAASMSPWWFVCFLVPGINLIAQIVWFIKISQARGKGLGLAMLLIFPLTNPFAALYLAFAGGEPSRREKRQRVEIMTLEAA